MNLRRRGWGLAAAGPGIAILVVCSGLPLAWMALVLVGNPSVRGEMALTSFRAALLGRTLGYNGLAALIATTMGLPAGIALGRGRGWLPRVLWVLLPSALLLPSLSYVYGWAELVRRLARVFSWLGISFLPAGPADTFRCIWSLGTWLWPLPAGLIGLSLRRMDSTVQQQAALDGAPRRIMLRQLAGPIIASMAIVTVLATQEFAVYEPTGISVVATEMRMVFDTGAVSSPENSITAPLMGMGGAHSPDQPARAAAAVATAAPLLLVTLLLAGAAAWGLSRESAASAVGPGDWPPFLDASRWTMAASFGLLIVNVGLPVWALVESLRAPFSPTRMFDEFAPQIEGTLLIAALASTLAMVASFSHAARWRRGALVTALASFLIGGQLLAIGLIRIFNRRGLIWAYDGAALPVIAYLGRFGWLAVSAGRSTWSRPWRELREVASTDGAGVMETAAGVIWPLAWPTLVAGGLLVGALSFTEVPATVLLLPQNPQVLTPTLMTWVHSLDFDPMIEASLLMMAAVIGPAIIAVSLASVGLRAVRLPGEGRKG